MAIAAKEPAEFRAGDTVKFTKSLPDYTPATDVLKYTFSSPQNQYTITATDNGDGDYLVNIPPATSATYAAGEYRWLAYIETGGDRYTVASGSLEIKPDLATGAVDDRTHVKKVLDALEAVILNKASKDQLSYSIAGRSLSLMSPDEILRWRREYRDEYRTEQQKERIALGLGNNRKIKHRFQ